MLVHTNRSTFFEGSWNSCSYAFFMDLSPALSVNPPTSNLHLDSTAKKSAHYILPQAARKISILLFFFTALSGSADLGHIISRPPSKTNAEVVAST